MGGVRARGSNGLGMPLLAFAGEERSPQVCQLARQINQVDCRKSECFQWVKIYAGGGTPLA